MFYVYIIYAEGYDKYYVGSSHNPWQRLNEHNTSKFHSYTSNYRPWVLKAVFKAGVTRGEAEKLEKFIKTQKSRRLILSLIDLTFQPVGKLKQLVRVPHVRD
jgi:putative endonuclease